MILKPTLALAAFICLASHPAAAQSVFSVLSKNTILGSWSGDCGKTMGKDNPTLIFSAPQSGRGSLVYDFGAGGQETTFTIKNATDLNAGRVALRVFESDESSLTDLVVGRSEGKIRLLSQHAFGAEQYQIKDGVVAGTGAETPWLSRCR
jgi:hypothetical protein